MDTESWGARLGANPAPSCTWFPPSFQPWTGSGSAREIAVLMSGGVDSSVAALLLKEAGWKVLGVTLNIPTATSCRHRRPCCGADAALVCRALAIPHRFLDVGSAFEAKVVEPFRRAYLEGRTANPCVDCNARVKFRVAWDFIEATLGIRHLATGHYAGVERVGEEAHLVRAADRARDQSYFIYGVPRGRLASLVLPVGGMSKPQVRAVARDRGLPVAAKQDSQDLCFAGGGDYRRALAGLGPAAPGPIRDTAGNAVGQHDGIPNFTVGQRRGLRVALGEPMYVVHIGPEDNLITVGTREEASRCRVVAAAPNVLIPRRLRVGARLLGKIRSYGEPAPCTVAEAGDRRLAVEFDAPQFAPAPGQHLVLYDDRDRLVAGGVICIEGPRDAASRQGKLALGAHS